MVADRIGQLLDGYDANEAISIRFARRFACVKRDARYGLVRMRIRVVAAIMESSKYVGADAPSHLFREKPGTCVISFDVTIVRPPNEVGAQQSNWVRVKIRRLSHCPPFLSACQIA